MCDYNRALKYRHLGSFVQWDGDIMWRKFNIGLRRFVDLNNN